MIVTLYMAGLSFLFPGLVAKYLHLIMGMQQYQNITVC